MTKTEYETLREKVVQRYQEDLAALDRIWTLFRGYEPPPSPAPGPPAPRAGRKRRGKLSEEEKIARNRAYSAAWRARQKMKKHGAGRNGAEEKGLKQKDFRKFLVPGPTGAGGSGDK